MRPLQLLARRAVTGWVLIVLSCCPAHAQLSTVFKNVFNSFLITDLQVSPGPHAGHFIPAANQADSVLVPALNSLIYNNIASFPISSASTGILFDFASGQPVRVPTSLGPIFGETARPVGAGKLALEVSYNYLDMNRIRGIPTDQMQFTFTHAHLVPGDTLGSDPTESDYMTVSMDMHVHASMAAIIASYGVTKDLDIGFAIPLIQMSVSGTATAVINSYTFAHFGFAFHYFGGNAQIPQLTTTQPYSQSATGVGDIAIRGKYSFLRSSDADAAALVDVRLPTGKQEDFLGTGKTTVRVWGILSRRMGEMTPHINIGYAHKPAELESDAVEFRAGFESLLLSDLTFALDILGQIDVNSSKAIHLLPGSVLIVNRPITGSMTEQFIPLSNIPDSNGDNLYNASMGFRFAPSEKFMLFANILVPLNSAGLRTTLAPTVGLSANL
ncbi:MAG TPA: hypothetical protein VL126_06610 [Bacteroidota bacterium]|nr:hypothetical protein [Bacteroidota bacterium]